MSESTNAAETEATVPMGTVTETLATIMSTDKPMGFLKMLMDDYPILFTIACVLIGAIITCCLFVCLRSMKSRNTEYTS